MTERSRVGTALRRWTIVHRFVLVIIAVRLVYVAELRLEDLAAPPHNWDNPAGARLIAGGITLLAGIALGFAARSRPPGTRIRPGTAAALGLVPLLLAMTYAMVWWDWPASNLSPSPLWRIHFYGGPLASLMWLFVGVAIAAGFERSEAELPSPVHPDPVEE